MACFLLMYDYGDNAVERRAPLREAHLELARAAQDRGELLLGGAFGDTVDGAVLVFEGDTAAVAEDFARHDPYVTSGLVTTWRVRPWMVVIGALAERMDRGRRVSPLDANKAVARGFVEQVVNTGDVTRVAAFVAPDCIETDGITRIVSGIEGMATHVTGVRRVYSGLTLTVDRQVAEGDWVATHVTARGEHTGAWLGIAPTGRPVTFTGVNLDRIVDGRMVEHGGAANMLLELMNIGAVRPVS